jgi:uncharacterized protein (DUF433 family)
MEDELLQRITLNPNVCFGKPTVRNMRYPVEMLLDLMSAGMTTEEILEDYDDLEKEDLQACKNFGRYETKPLCTRSAEVVCGLKVRFPANLRG